MISKTSILRRPIDISEGFSNKDKILTQIKTIINVLQAFVILLKLGI